MYFSNREIKMVFLLLNHRNGLTRDDLSRNLQVSRRTIYRELSSLEATLAKIQIKLIKKKGYYCLIGEPTTLKRLRHKISKLRLTGFLDIQRRQSAEISRLLLANKVLTMENLAYEFNVSVSTIKQDLNAIEPILLDYRLNLFRKKSRGVYVSGEESNVRRVLSGVLNSEINEYDFFELLRHPKTMTEMDYSSRYFIELLDLKLLKISSRVIKDYQKKSEKHFSDSQLQQLIIIVTISVMRLSNCHDLHKLNHVDKNELFKYYPVAISIFKQFPMMIRDQVSLLELEFLSLQLQGMDFLINKNTLLENYDLTLSYQIRSLIQEVSIVFHWDFRRDGQLFNDLIAHISNSLSRFSTKLPELNNANLQQIKLEYTQLYSAIASSLKKIFPHNAFKDSDIAYIMIHFAASYEKHVKSQNLSALVVCANGIGTAKILEMRLKKNIPELTDIHVSRVMDLNYLNFNQYNIVLSTIALPGFPLNYKMVTPLLLNSEAKEIRDYLILHYGRNTVKENVKKVPQRRNAQNFQKVYKSMTVANNILKRITIHRVDNKGDLLSILLTITSRLKGDVLINYEWVSHKLYERIYSSPVGIPHSHLALVHTTDSAIRYPQFSLYDLKTALPIKSMSGEVIQLKRMLLLLGPDKISPIENDLMGRISSSVIENDFNLAVYESGDRNDIYRLVSSLFLDEVQRLN